MFPATPSSHSLLANLKSHFHLRDDWVSSSHLKAIDIWILLCYNGVFFSLVEYCTVLYVTKGIYYWEPKRNQVQNDGSLGSVASEYVSLIITQ